MTTPTTTVDWSLTIKSVNLGNPVFGLGTGSSVGRGTSGSVGRGDAVGSRFKLMALDVLDDGDGGNCTSDMVRVADVLVLVLSILDVLVDVLDVDGVGVSVDVLVVAV